MDALDFSDFTPTEFEEFCFELLRGLPGVHNVDWRKGTPKPTSPADRGRDITLEVDHVDIGGARTVELWFADCKHYTKGVPPEALNGLLTWAQAERPRVALVIASGFLSNGAKDFVADFERNNTPPFRITYWERPTLETLARENAKLLERFFATGTPFTPTDAEHIAQCEQAGCRHPAIYVIDGDPSDTAQGWCQLCRDVAHQQAEELLALASHRRMRADADAEPASGELA